MDCALPRPEVKRSNLIDTLMRETEALVPKAQSSAPYSRRIHPSADPSRDPDTEGIRAPQLFPDEMAGQKVDRPDSRMKYFENISKKKRPDTTVSFPPTPKHINSPSILQRDTVDFSPQNSVKFSYGLGSPTKLRPISRQLPISRQSALTANALSLNADDTVHVLQNILPFRAPMPNLPPALERKLPLTGPVLASQLVRKVFECKRVNSPYKVTLQANAVTREQLIQHKIIKGYAEIGNVSDQFAMPNGEDESIFLSHLRINADENEGSSRACTSLPSLSDRASQTSVALVTREALPSRSLALNTSASRGIASPFKLATSTTRPIIDQLLGERPSSRVAQVRTDIENQWAINPLNKYSVKTTLLDGTVITKAAPGRLSPTIAKSIPVVAKDTNSSVLDMSAPFSSQFEQACEKVNADLQQQINERLAEAGKIEAASFVVTHLTRPSWPRDGRRKKDFSGFTFSFKYHLRTLLRWSIGRIISQLRERGIADIADAKSKVITLRNIKKKKDERQLYQSRVKGATALLEEVADVMKHTKQQLQARELTLTSESYLKLRRQFEFASGGERMVLSLFELQEMAINSGTDFDVKLFRKIDLDRGGYLEFDEIVHSLYPTIPLKPLRLLMRRFDEENGLESVWRKKIAVESAKAALMTVAQKKAAAAALVEEVVLQLTPESKEQVNSLFHATDEGGKGYVTREDMVKMFILPMGETEDPLSSGPFWFDNKFQTVGSVVGLDIFTEMVKMMFPPFKNTATTQVQRAYKPPPVSPIPAEIMELQRRLVNKPGYVK